MKTERQKGRETERQRDRETERQKDRETERQKDRKAERQKDRETERQRDRETQRLRDRKTEKQKDRKTESDKNIWVPFFGHVTSFLIDRINHLPLKIAENQNHWELLQYIRNLLEEFFCFYSELVLV